MESQGCAHSMSFARLPSGPAPVSSNHPPIPDGNVFPVFDVSKHINLVPSFREAENRLCLINGVQQVKSLAFSLLISLLNSVSRVLKHS